MVTTLLHVTINTHAPYQLTADDPRGYPPKCLCHYEVFCQSNRTCPLFSTEEDIVPLQEQSCHQNEYINHS